jgi:hypothetical protein
MRKIIIKTMQIDNKEFQKCKSGQEFKAKFISHPGPRPPVKPIGPDTNNEDDVVVPPKPPRKSLDERITEAVAKALVPVIIRLDKIDDRLERHDAMFKEHG